jgi:hypothetical protein
MWTLILVLAIHGSVFTEPQTMMTNIPGFSSKENCLAAGESLAKENQKRGSWIYHCIEVK